MYNKERKKGRAFSTISGRERDGWLWRKNGGDMETSARCASVRLLCKLGQPNPRPGFHHCILFYIYIYVEVRYSKFGVCEVFLNIIWKGFML